ncbi:MAG: Uma2 family endonuclease, partial [Microcystis aeruginosa LE13-04]|nr:Uma2 family endonuclease [Microcystis aeruginosa LE13-04]
LEKEQERQAKEQALLEKEQERQAKERLAAKLRELGINPQTI